jgi:hypothetical protein
MCAGRILLPAAVALLVGCGKGAEVPDDGSVFLAVASDFSGFESWTSSSYTSTTPTGSTHVSGTRTVYINQAPPAGATEFPIGTLIVKVTEADGKIFARAKRGGNFNSAGARNWEWFELQEGTSGLSIRWHGFGPPAGEMYGGDAKGGCNGCHAAATANDYVLSPALQLMPAVGNDDGGATDAGGE